MDRFQRSLPLKKQEYQELLDRLDSNEDRERKSDQSDSKRFQYRVPDIPLSIEQPQGGVSSFLVLGRNISRAGMSVLHGGYVHVGSLCRLVLAREGERSMLVTGEVRFCRLVSGTWHEIGIRFHEEIDAAALPGSAADERPEPNERPRRREPGPITGSILVAEPFAPDLLLLSHHLAVLGLDLRIATTPGASLDAVKRKPADLILFGLNCAKEEGLRTLRRIRALGYRRPILLMTAETDSAAIDRARRAGATDIIAKPYHIDLLIAQLRAHLGDGEPTGPFYSTAAHEPGMPSLIKHYIQFVRRTADQVDRTFHEGEWAELRELCCQLKGSGCGYGFQHLTVAAISALNRLDRDPRSGESRSAIRFLLECCLALEVRDASERAA